MMDRGRLAGKYIFFEMLPSFLMGLVVFIFILLMFQALRLTEFILIHGVSTFVIFEIIGYLSISFLPVLLPMSLLFSILLTYGRLSHDSEIVALKALGVHPFYLALPAFVLASLATVASAEISFNIAPWGNRKFEVLIHELGQQRVGATIKEGVFSEGFFNLTVYANSVDSKQGLLNDIFIYDERDPQSPLTIIAKEGQVITKKTQTGSQASLKLHKGNIHRSLESTYTKVDFQTYTIQLFEPFDNSERRKSTPSFTLSDLRSELKNPNLDPSTRTRLGIEYHRRWAMSSVCLIFAFLGVGLGTVTNKRQGKSSGLVLCIVLIVSYWLLYILAENVAKNQWAPPSVALWSVNAVFLVLGMVVFRNTLR